MSDRAPADAGITPVGAPADAGAFPVGAAVTLAQLDVDPYPVLHRLRAAEPVSWIPAAGQWFVTRRNLAMEVMRDQERYRTDDPHSPIRDTFGAQMLSTEGEEQRRYKSACAPPFTGRAVEATEPLVARVADRWLGALPAAGPVEVREAYAAPVALEVIARVIGLDEALDGELRGWYDTFVAALMNYARDPRTRTRAHAAARAFHAAIAPRIRHPRAEERALLDALATAHPRLLDDEEIGANALIVLFGGIETTEGLIANALWALLSHPEALRRARSGPADLARAIDESLRWEPAVQTVTRYAAHDARVGDTTIPRGAVVQCMLGALNRDPAHVREPDRFDPWREGTAAHLAFGAGRHVCLGAALARLEGQVALGRLLEAHPRLALDAERTRGPRGREFRKVEALVVRLEG